MNAKTTLGQYLSVNKAVIENKIKASLPKHMDIDKVMRAFSSELARNPQLKECEPKSVIESLSQAAQLGLEVNSILGHAYLIPFNKGINKNKGTNLPAAWDNKKMCQFILGYRGMIALARRSGQIVSIYAQAVYENDRFEFCWGINEKLEHTPADGDRGKFKCAYAIAKLANTYTSEGQIGIQFDVMNKSDIDKIRGRSKSDSSGKSSPWVTDYDEMAKKTVLRRLFKYLPISIDIQEHISSEEARDLGINDDIDFDSDIEDGVIVAETKSDILANKLKSTDNEPIATSNPENSVAPSQNLAELKSRIDSAKKEDLEKLLSDINSLENYTDKKIMMDLYKTKIKPT